MKPLASMGIVIERELAEGGVDTFQKTIRELCARLGIDEAWAGEMISASRQAARGAA